MVLVSGVLSQGAIVPDVNSGLREPWQQPFLTRIVSKYSGFPARVLSGTICEEPLWSPVVSVQFRPGQQVDAAIFPDRAMMLLRHSSHLLYVP
jgi:hypothetical protein